MSLLEISALTKRFGGVVAVDGCSLSVADRSITGLICPNGSGKTTVFNLMTGFIPVDRGSRPGPNLRPGHRPHLPAGPHLPPADGAGEHARAGAARRPAGSAFARAVAPRTGAGDGDAGIRRNRPRRRDPGRRALLRAAQAPRAGGGDDGSARAGAARRTGGWGQSRAAGADQRAHPEAQPAGGDFPAGRTQHELRHEPVRRGGRAAPGEGDRERQTESGAREPGGARRLSRSLTMAALLELQEVTAGYGGGDILHELDLKVEEGGVTCIVGPNGAGKSTVLRVVSGLLRPRLGTIRFRGRSIAGLSPRAILQRGIVQVPQERSLFATMTVWENVRMGAYTVHDGALIERRLQQVCDTFSIVRDRRYEPAASLSGGQQKIVEFARALMLDPALVILDEPSMGLDPKTRTTVFDTIRAMNQAGRTILLVEQNARSGLGLASHGVVMESGRIRLEGPGPTVLNNPEIGRRYLGATA